MANVLKLGKYKEIEVNVELKEISMEEVEQQMKVVLESKPLWIEKEGVVENGDMTTIDFEGFKDGVAFEGGKGENYQLEIGSNTFIPGFEEQMIGMQVNETRDLNLSFPENYGAKELAGKEVVFTVTVHAIQQKNGVEYSDEYVKMLEFPNISTLDELKKAIQAQMEKQAQDECYAQMEQQVIEKLLGDCEVELTDQEIEDAIQKEISQAAQQFTMYGITLQQYYEMSGTTEEDLKNQLKEPAQMNAKLLAIFDEIVKLEGIESSEEEVKQYLTGSQIEIDETNIQSFKEALNRYKANQMVFSSVKK